MSSSTSLIQGRERKGIGIRPVVNNEQRGWFSDKCDLIASANASANGEFENAKKRPG